MKFTPLPLTTSLLYLFLFKSTVPAAEAGCACETIDSFQNLKNIIENSNQDLVRLCPFNVEKENSIEGIIVPHAMHIMCAKESREDECVIHGIGNTGSNPSKNYDAIIIENVDDVWLQGLTFRQIHKGAVKAAGQNLQITDCVFENCQSPPETTGAIVEIMLGGSALIVDSRFQENEGGAIQSHGFLTVSHCDFIDNEATPFWISNDSNENRGGGVGGAIMNGMGGSLFVFDSRFDGNKSDGEGPAIWSYDEAAIDLGSNCGENNRIVDFILQDPEVVLGYCDGIFYRHTEGTKTRLCATFGGPCKR